MTLGWKDSFFCFDRYSVDLIFFSLSALILEYCSVLLLFLCRWKFISSLGMFLLVCFLLVFVLDLSTICFVVIVIVVFDTLWVFFVFVCELLMVPYFLFGYCAVGW